MLGKLNSFLSHQFELEEAGEAVNEGTASGDMIGKARQQKIITGREKLKILFPIPGV